MNNEEQQTPTCPNYNYNLTGLVNSKFSIPCPECGQTISYEQATEQVSRIRVIKKAFLWLFIFPLIIALWPFTIYQIWEYDDDFLFEIGFVPNALSFYIIFILMLVYMIKEPISRKKLKGSKVKPSLWISLLSFFLFAAVSLSISFFVLVMWAEAIASV